MKTTELKYDDIINAIIEQDIVSSVSAAGESKRIRVYFNLKDCSYRIEVQYQNNKTKEKDIKTVYSIEDAVKTFNQY